MSKPKILIAGPAWIGDMVMAQSLFILLRQRFPEAAIDVVAPAWSEDVLARMPQVRRSILQPVGHGELGLSERWRIGKRLRDERYDHAIVLPRSLKSALIPFFARAARRTGFRGEMRYGLLNDVRRLDRTVLDQTVKRFIALGIEAGETLPEPPPPVLRVDRDNFAKLANQLDLAGDAAPVAMMPGAAYGPAKCWPVASFAELAIQLNERDIPVWVLGSDKDFAAGEAICAAAGVTRARNLCGKTRLVDSIDLLGAARAAVTNDSGLMHVAAAAGCHVVAIYGSTSPAFTPPLTSRRTIHYLDLDCSPCFQRECPLGHLRCLREIRPEAVLQSI